MGRSYIIKRGDTLESIAKATGSTVDAIAKNNGIGDPAKVDPDMMRQGNTLLIPDGTEETKGNGVQNGGILKAPAVGNETKTEGGSAPLHQEFYHPGYVESDAVRQAQAALGAQLAQKPGAYQSQWQTQINDIINRILNREEFSYDLNGDALYQQHKDRYIQQGKMAMQDTMGQAAAMTGGYGNSYAATVGNQAYQAQLGKLNDVIPELWQMAYDRYNREGQALYDRYAMLGERESADYAKHRDQLGDWQAERDFLAGRYDAERNHDYGKYAEDRDFAYATHRDAVGDQQRKADFDEAVRQYNEQFEYQQNRDKAEDDAQGAAGSGTAPGDGWDIELTHVATMSSAELVGHLRDFNADGDNVGLAAFLDDCVATGRLSEAQADAYYAQYLAAEE